MSLAEEVLATITSKKQEKLEKEEIEKEKYKKIKKEIQESMEFLEKIIDKDFESLSNIGLKIEKNESPVREDRLKNCPTWTIKENNGNILFTIYLGWTQERNDFDYDADYGCYMRSVFTDRLGVTLQLGKDKPYTYFYYREGVKELIKDFLIKYLENK